MTEAMKEVRVPLGDVANEAVNQSGPEGEFVYVDISSVDRDSKKIVVTKQLGKAQAPSRAKQVLEAGDVLVSMTRPNLNAVALVPDKLNGAIGSTGFHVLRSKHVKPEFLFYLVQTDEFIRAMCDQVQGALYPAVRPKDIHAFQLRLESALQQARIVEKLEELLSGLDAGVAELKAAQRKLARYRQSLLKAAVQGDLTAAWRARHPPQETGAQLLARILAERRTRWEARQLAKFAQQGKAPPRDWRQKYPEPVRPDTAGLPALPQGWVWATVDQLAQVGTGVTPLRSRNAYFNGGAIPWVTSGALNSEVVASASEFVTELALKECRLEIFPAGSLLIAMYGEGKTRGKCAELAIPATINQAIAAVVLEPAALACTEFVKAFFLHSYQQMREQASGGVQPNLNLQIVKSMVLPLPPLAEQTEIAQVLAGCMAEAEQLRGAVAVSLQQSTAQRQNLLRAAFSGQLLPQNPADEPASALLARIRAERAAPGAARKPRGRQKKEAA